MMSSCLAELAVLAAGLTDVNPGLTFWTIITFLIVLVVLRAKAWRR
jgi:F-type H+-transporting ATPase subunit b